MAGSVAPPSRLLRRHRHRRLSLLMHRLCTVCHLSKYDFQAVHTLLHIFIPIMVGVSGNGVDTTTTTPKIRTTDRRINRWMAFDKSSNSTISGTGQIWHAPRYPNGCPTPSSFSGQCIIWLYLIWIYIFTIFCWSESEPK